MHHSPRRSVVLARVLLAMFVGLTATACSGAGGKAAAPARLPSIAATPADQPVQATGLPDAVELEVADTSPGVEHGDNLDFVSPVFTLTPAGPLARPATVRLQLNNALPRTTPLLVASRVSESQPWTYRRGRLTSDQQHVEFKTTSLNQVGVLALDLDGALANFRTDVRSGLATLTERKPEKPTCEGAGDAAREDGYSVASTKSKTMFWCFGLENDKRVLRVTNRKRVPVEVTHVNVPVVTEAPEVPSYSLLSSLLEPEKTLLAPGRTATYDADLEPKGRVQVIAESPVQAQSLRFLQAGTRALVIRMNRFGAGPVKIGKTVDALMAKPQCAKTLSQSAEAVAAGCFSRPKLMKVFGANGLLLAPLISAPSFPVFMQKQGEALTTQAATVHQRVVVRRAAPDFSDLVGLFSGLTRLLTIGADGTVEEKIQEGCCDLVIRLGYQLEEPVTKAGTTTANATLTFVKVGRRKLLDGRVPRVGEIGTITLSKGVITPPYLKKSYCDSKVAKKDACDA
ncbi:MAG TPA: hypothetical protein VFD59_17210 [Nocardioidaceae bacterium]|nr:hypothetical protein [Nocardioidaceae bacterium]